MCHFTLLNFDLEMGMKLWKVLSAIRFRQKRVVEPYIKCNTESTIAFEIGFYTKSSVIVSMTNVWNLSDAALIIC